MILTLKDLVAEYQSGGKTLRVLDIPNWSVNKGEQVAISGPSGSGKSTLLNIIAGLMLPTRGTITVAGSELTKLSEAERDRFRANSVGYIFQNFNLLQGYTALENILLGMSFGKHKSDRNVAMELLSMVGLASRSNHYPSALSIGEQQRVAIARALSKQPELIIADEPTGSLDPMHTDGVISILRKVSSDLNCTLVLVSHEQSVVSKFEEQITFLELNQAFKQNEGTR